MEHVQQVTGRVQAAKIGDARALFDALEAHRRELSGQRGFMNMRINRSSEPGGDTLVSVETRWSSAAALEEYAGGARNAESILAEFPDLLVPDSIDARTLEAMETEAESRTKLAYERLLLGALVPVVILGFGLAFIYALSRIYLQMGAGATATTTAIVISGAILLVAWYFASNEKAPAWQFVGVGAISVAALLGGGLAAQVMEDPHHEEENGVGEPTPPPSGGLLLTLEDNVFLFEGQENPAITVGANVPVTIQLDNTGTALHNVHVAAPDYAGSFCETGGEAPCSDPDQIDGGTQGVLEFNLPPGTYDYRCDFHTAEMSGTFEVVEGGPTGGEPPPPPPGGPGEEPGEPGGISVEMQDNVFVVDGEENPEINVPADVPVTLTLENTGAALHNMHIAAGGDFETSFCETDGDVPCSDPDQVQSDETATISFTLPAGEYTYRCDFHTEEMEGTLVVGGP